MIRRLITLDKSKVAIHENNIIYIYVIKIIFIEILEDEEKKKEE